MADRTSDSIRALDEQQKRFHERMARLAAGAGVVVGPVLGAISFSEGSYELGAASVVVAVCSLAILALCRAGRLRTALEVVVLATALAGITGGTSVGNDVPANVAAIFMLGGMLASWLLGPREAVAVSGLGVAVCAVSGWRVAAAGMIDGEVAPTIAAPLAMLLFFMGAVWVFTRSHRETAEALRERVAELETVAASAEQIADGDLGVTLEADGHATEVMRDMAERLRSIVGGVQDTMDQLGESAMQLKAAATAEQRGATRQAGAIYEAGRSLDRVVVASQGIAEGTVRVSEAASATQQANKRIAERTEALLASTKRLAQLLEGIKDVARRADILALNAALEGVNAGEAGRGFALVAEQMQGLAAMVASSVEDGREAIAAVSAAAEETRQVVAEGEGRSASATQEAAEIRARAEQQHEAVEKLREAMREIRDVAQTVSDESERTLAAAKQLTASADGLRETVAHFRT